MSEENKSLEGDSGSGLKSAQIISGYDKFDDFIKDGLKTVMEGIRSSNSFASGTDFDFYRTHESFNKIVSEENDKVMRSINSILKLYGVQGNVKSRGLEEKTELIVEANDVILENAAGNIDEMNGIKKNPQEPVVMQAVSVQLPVNGSWNRINPASFSVTSMASVSDKIKEPQDTIRLLTGKNIVRPQSFFKDKIDNTSLRPWEPRIKEKPNSLKPLAIFLEETENGEEFSHPYEFELDRFEPSLNDLKATKAIQPKCIKETPLIEVTTEKDLKSLLKDLYNCSEIAVDLEHHSYRSFMGITCLLQISTREKDYLVDALALRDKLFILNEIFTKPSVVKVFHGADMDIQWLQRDLSLYVVNMFDTHQAAKQLEYSGLSLAYLMNRFCNIQPNKHFQLADWRIRPLPEELKTYAREDTHYLIYIYHILKKELLKKANGKDNLLRAVYQRSTDICKKRYFKPILKDDSHLEFYRKCKRSFNNRQMYALRELYRWRDQISREEDESTGYVLPNHMLLQVAEALPREMQGILACCNPIPPLVRANLLELHHIILRAREQSLEKPILKEENRGRGSTKQIFKINVDSPLHCPHDLSSNSEFRDDLPTLLNTKEVFNIHSKSLEKATSVMSVFDSPENSENETDKGITTKLKELKFLAPYERYKLVKPFIEAEEAKAAAENEKNSDKEEAKEFSMEDRIAALHAHFVKEAQSVPQKAPKTSEETPVLEEPATLVEMGSSKKRKRTEAEEEDDYHPDYEMPGNDLHIPIPNIKKPRGFKGRSRGNKRRFVDQLEDYEYKKGRREGVDNVGKGKRQYQNQQNQQQQNQNWKQNKNKKQVKQQQNMNWQRNKQASQQQNSGGKKNKKRQRQQEEQQQQFNAFDYSSVDYSQFQGGGRSVTQAKQVKSAFKNKGRKKQNRGGSNNRSFTFGGGGGGRGGRRN